MSILELSAFIVAFVVGVGVMMIGVRLFSLLTGDGRDRAKKNRKWRLQHTREFMRLLQHCHIQGFFDKHETIFRTFSVFAECLRDSLGRKTWYRELVQALGAFGVTEDSFKETLQEYFVEIKTRVSSVESGIDRAMQMLIEGQLSLLRDRIRDHYERMAEWLRDNNSIVRFCSRSCLAFRLLCFTESRTSFTFLRIAKDAFGQYQKCRSIEEMLSSDNQY